MRADPPTGDALQEQLAGVTQDVGSVLDGLVEIARGIHPAILSQGGLAAALKALARRSAVPVDLHARIEGPLPDEVEVAAYYAAAEALTNTAKHARASVVHMDVTTDDGTLTLMVRDDGVGGADLRNGSGLVGLQDRVEALGGRITIDSPPGSGTGVVVTLPMATRVRPGTRELPRSATRARVAHESGLRSEPGPAAQHRPRTRPPTWPPGSWKRLAMPSDNPGLCCLLEESVVAMGNCRQIGNGGSWGI